MPLPAAYLTPSQQRELLPTWRLLQVIVTVMQPCRMWATMRAVRAARSGSLTGSPEDLVVQQGHGIACQSQACSDGPALPRRVLYAPAGVVANHPHQEKLQNHAGPNSAGSRHTSGLAAMLEPLE